MISYAVTSATLVLATVVASPAAAQAAWDATGHDTITVRAVELPAAHDPVAVVDGSTVKVRWPATKFGPVRGYRVTRTDEATGRVVPAGHDCAGVVSTTSCTEDDVPDGRWTYGVVAVAGRYWTSEPGTGSTVVIDTNPSAPGVAVPGDDVLG